MQLQLYIWLVSTFYLLQTWPNMYLFPRPEIDAFEATNNVKQRFDDSSIVKRSVRFPKK